MRAIRQIGLREVGEGVWRALGHYGFMESPDVSHLVDLVQAAGKAGRAAGSPRRQPRHGPGRAG